MQNALITGATSGIGYALAHLMAKQGHDLVLIARKETLLVQLKDELENKYGVSVSILSNDLSQPHSAHVIFERYKDADIEILINNAGAGHVGDFFESSVEKNSAMIALNITALMELTHFFGAQFKMKNRGRILNVASVAAFIPGPRQPVYYATKAFVRSFSRALSYTLRNTNVTVTALYPGYTKTHFFIAADAPSFTKGADAADVALYGYRALMAGKAEVTYGFWNQVLTNIFVRITPYRWQALMVDKTSEV